MYNKKYRLQNIETERNNPMHAEILGKVCYLAYFKKGERGWFLCDTEATFDCDTGATFDPVHRIHISEVKDVQYTRGNQVIVSTENTKYVFEVILDGKEN